MQGVTTVVLWFDVQHHDIAVKDVAWLQLGDESALHLAPALITRAMKKQNGTDATAQQMRKVIILAPQRHRHRGRW